MVSIFNDTIEYNDWCDVLFIYSDKELGKDKTGISF